MDLENYGTHRESERLVCRAVVSPTHLRLKPQWWARDWGFRSPAGRGNWDSDHERVGGPIVDVVVVVCCCCNRGNREAVGPASMSYPSWPLGQCPWEPAGFPRLQWERMIPPIPPLRRPLRLALPCVGLDAACHAAVQMGVAVDPVYVWDIDHRLWDPLLHLHGLARARAFNLGDEGDLQMVRLDDLQRVDGIISGPPCQPSSRIGSKKRRQDARACIWDITVDIIIRQGHLGAWFFILENVPGIADREKDETHQSLQPSILESTLSRLRTESPMWTVNVWKLNSASYVPQDRPRFYVVGINQQCARGAPCPPCLPPRPQPHIFPEILHQGLPRFTEHHLCSQQQQNLQMYKEHLAHREPTVLSTDSGDQPVFLAAVEVDRNPSRSWGSCVRVDGLISTLRCGHESTWLLAWTAEGHLTLSRGLHPLERLALQGLPPELGASMSKSLLVHATGNCFTAPVVGAVLSQVMRHIMGHEVLERPVANSEASRLKELMLLRLRREIALLDATTREYRAMAASTKPPGV